MANEEDWRLTNQLSYLQGVTLRWERWTSPSDDWDHDHCEFCWAEFSDDEEMPHLRTGLVTADDRQKWICPPCFRDFHERFNWIVENEAP